MAGTNPEQGAALARATVERLAGGRALRHHHDPLRQPEGAGRGGPRASATPAWNTTSSKLRPTFRLRDGLPGRSYALDIAARMGLPAPVLERAQELLGATSLGLENVLRDLEQREDALLRAEQALDAARVALEARADEEKAAAQALARRERDLGLRTRELLDEAMRDARSGHRRRGPRGQGRAFPRHRGGGPAASWKRPPRRPAPACPSRRRWRRRWRSCAKPWPPAPSASPQRKTVRTARPRSSSSPRASRASSSASEPPIPASLQTRANSVDVRGMRADEALRQLEAFLDQAALDGQDSIFVIHGHGTGALRRAVREYLATSPYVERFRPGGPGEGGDGVSVVSVRG